MTFATGDSWPDWQRNYRFGALVIEPPADLAAGLDAIRERFDPVSARRVGAHISVTPPLARAPTPDDEARMGSVLREVPAMRLQLEAPRQFEGSSVLYLPVVNAPAVMRLRETLLATGLFRLDLPHTSDFVPHLTISEFGTEPAAALRTVIPALGIKPFPVRAIAWLVPDEAFQFRCRRTFSLGGAAD